MAQMTATKNGKPPAASAKTLRIGDLLLERGLITPEQVDAALTIQKGQNGKKLLGEIMVEQGYVTEDQVAEAIAAGYDLPYAKITPRLADPKVFEVLPRELIEKHGVLPLFLVNGRLTVAIHEPSNLFLVEEIERHAGCPVQLVVTTAADIKAALKAHAPHSNVFVLDDIVEGLDTDNLSVIEKQVTDLTSLVESAGQSPVVKIVNYLIYTAVSERASDIHIEPEDKRLRVRFRLDGRLQEKISPPYQMAAAVASRIKIMANLDIAERRVPQDGAIHIMLDGRQIDLRVSTMPGKFGEKVVIRVIDNSNIQVAIGNLGFTREMLDAFSAMIHQPNGIILVTGPTGSGKSTTLYSILGEVNDPETNICTVEDPVEYSLSGVNQFQVNEKAGFTFSGALRALLRQDPDIIMVGEIRDVETAKLASQAALTGHLVLSTLHTNDAPSAVARLVNMGVEGFLIAASLRGVLAQRLVRKICSHCKQPVEVNASVRKAVEQCYGRIDTYYRGTGCNRCRNTGYAGRLGIYELLDTGPKLTDLITRGAGPVEIAAAAAAHGGYTTLRLDGMNKVKQGLTTVDEVLRATSG